MSKHYIIVGAGPAGVIAAETLRKTDSQCQVTLFAGEPEPPYSRMAIPYLLVGNIDEAGTYLRKAKEHYDAMNVIVHHDTVANVDAAQRQVRLSGGSVMGYDKLLVATGSRALLPPVPGIDLPNIYNCWTLEDARHIAKHASQGARVLLVGAGFIGCIVLEALASRGVQLTVVEMGDRMVPRMMNETAGGMIKRWCETKGVRVHTSTKVESIAKSQADGDALSVSLSNGETMDFDVVISAAGVAPNIDILDGTGVKTDRGVLVNEYLQSSDPDIYAAGDCAQARDFSTGEMEVHAIQPTAAEHGRIAALNMAGHESRYEGSFNMNVLDTLGLVSTSFGLWMGVDNGEQVELSDPDNFRYLNLQFRDDVMVGATSLGMTQHVGVLRGLIQSEPKLGKWKEHLMQDPTRLSEAYLNTGLAYR